MSDKTEFIIDARDHLKAIENSLLSVEQSANLDSAGAWVAEGLRHSLRAAHSLKGDAGLLGLNAIRTLAHAMESLLESIRDGRVQAIDAIDTILLTRDRLAAMVEDLDHSTDTPIDDLIAKMESLHHPSDRIRISWRLPAETSGTEVPWHELLLTHARSGVFSNVRIGGIDRLESPINTANVSIEADVRGALNLSELFSHSSVDSYFSINWMDNVLNAHPKSESSDPRLLFFQEAGPLGLPIEPIVLSDLASHPKSVKPITPLHSDSQVAEPIVARPITVPSATKPTHFEPEKLHSLRVSVELVDRLMNLVGELTLIRNQGKVAFHQVVGESAAILQRLDSVTSELQDTVIRTRMQPIGNLFGKFPRMVRDLGRQLGRQIAIESTGNEVELDKTVIEQLSDPMMHLIRNSVDHGIEPPEVRKASGKPIEGRIWLTAVPADGQVLITIRDDGKGIDIEAISRKAIASGLRSESEIARMSKQEILSLILLPGFSTAKQVTDISGRGVGMDVVKTNLERIDGSLSIDSELGRGTVITLRVPLTLAIIPCLIVTQGDQRLVVPQRDLEEIVCIHPGSKRAMEQTLDGEFFRLRDRLLPVVRANEVLDRPRRFNEATCREIVKLHPAALRDPKSIEYILVLRSRGRRFGLLVDHVIGQEEIVIKPMHPSLKRIPIFAGATLMGDGRVALILNVDGIADHSDCHGIEVQEREAETRKPEEVHRIVLFESGSQERFAIPLIQIRRIESVRLNAIESVGPMEFIQVDGRATEVIRLDHHLKVSPCIEHDEMFLILPKYETRPFGILASKIIDVDSLAIDLQLAEKQMHGVLGTACIRDRMTLFIDLHYVDTHSRSHAEPTIPETTAFITSEGTPAFEASKPGVHPEQVKTAESKRILLVDDTSFFREIVRRYLEARSHEIHTAVDGLDGLKKLEAKRFDLVVSDIEMPQMNGWEFCKEARRRGYDMPFIALTSLERREHLEQALACGFNAYEEKLDHDRLVHTVERWLLASTGTHP